MAVQVAPPVSFPNWYIPLLIVVIVISGSLGGYVNYYLTRAKDEGHVSLKESLVIGVAAAFLVPLFLQMISSTLLRNGASNPLELFIFAGFCILASISSRSFVQTLSEKLLRQARDDAQIAKDVAREAKEEVNKVKGATDSVQRQTELAIANVGPQSEGAVAISKTASPEEALEALVNSYNELRKTPPSRERTKEMTAVFRQLIDLSPSLNNFPVQEYLGETNRGRRLAAYAYLYSRPNFALLRELINSVINIEDKPFGQYWGIQTIGKVIGGKTTNEIQGDILNDLRRFRTSLAPGTDRYYEIARLLEDIDKRSESEA